MDSREKNIYRVTLTGTAVNALLIILKMLAGVIGRSSAMIADAVHSLSDFVTDVIVLIFVKVSNKPRDAGHGYGHGKYETFATMIIGLILALAGVALFVNGCDKVYTYVTGGQQPCRPSVYVLVAAVFSVVIKEWLYRYTVKTGKELNSSALIANAWHHRSDAISSVGTFAGIAGAVFLGDKWIILDPLAAIVVSFFIMKSGYDIMRPSVNELLEGSLPQETESDITSMVLSVSGISGVHNMRTRRIGNGIAIELHAIMDGSITLDSAHAKASEAERLIRAKYGQNTLISIHMEPDKRKLAAGR